MAGRKSKPADRRKRKRSSGRGASLLAIVLAAALLGMVFFLAQASDGGRPILGATEGREPATDSDAHGITDSDREELRRVLEKLGGEE